MYPRLSRQLSLGTIHLTDMARDALLRSQEDVADYLARHAAGDWGDVTPEDAADNDYAVAHDLRVTSAYHTQFNDCLLVVSDPSAGVTEVLRPEEV